MLPQSPTPTPSSPEPTTAAAPSGWPTAGRGTVRLSGTFDVPDPSRAAVATLSFEERGLAPGASVEFRLSGAYAVRFWICYRAGQSDPSTMIGKGSTEGVAESGIRLRADPAGTIRGTLHLAPSRPAGTCPTDNPLLGNRGGHWANVELHDLTNRLILGPTNVYWMV